MCTKLSMLSSTGRWRCQDLGEAIASDPNRLARVYREHQVAIRGVTDKRGGQP